MNPENRRAYRKRARQECFQHYGEVCACCGESERAFLTLDHVAKDGAAHRLAIGTGGHLCEHLRSKGFPPGFQTLCHNCNWARSALGACPHQDATKRWQAWSPPQARAARPSTLTPEQEAEIRAKYVPYYCSCRMLADEYKVSYATIWRVVKQSPKCL